MKGDEAVERQMICQVNKMSSGERGLRAPLKYVQSWGC